MIMKDFLIFLGIMACATALALGLLWCGDKLLDFIMKLHDSDQSALAWGILFILLVIALYFYCFAITGGKLSKK